jgi:hypothetical protein
MAALSERIAETSEKIASIYLRVEPHVELAHFHHLRSERAQAYLYAKHASEIAA